MAPVVEKCKLFISTTGWYNRELTHRSTYFQKGA